MPSGKRQRIERAPTRRTPGPSRRRVLVRVGRLASTTVREGVVSGRPDVATYASCWAWAPRPTGHRADEPTHGPGSRSLSPRSMSSRRLNEEAEVLVATADGKGVPMRRPLEERIRSGHRRGKELEKANKKQMSYVGAGVQYRPFSSYGRRCCGRSAAPSSGLGTARSPSTNSSGPR